MWSCEHSVKTDIAPEAIWEAWSDVERWPAWNGDIARIELPEQDLVRAVTEPARSAIVAAVRRAGFRFAVVDLAGIQSGRFTLTLLSQANE